MILNFHDPELHATAASHMLLSIDALFVKGFSSRESEGIQESKLADGVACQSVHVVQG